MKNIVKNIILTFTISALALAQDFELHSVFMSIKAILPPGQFLLDPEESGVALIWIRTAEWKYLQLIITMELYTDSNGITVIPSPCLDRNIKKHIQFHTKVGSDRRYGWRRTWRSNYFYGL